MLRELSAIFLSFLLLECASIQQYEEGSGVDRGQPPVVLDYYAPEVIPPGSTWRVYLRAKDNDNDMKSIAAILWQAGVGYYRTDFTWVKEKDSGELAGYLYLRTPPTTTLIWDRLELTILIRDRQWNRSEAVKLPLRFALMRPKEIPEKWQTYASNRLGVIALDVVSSHIFNSGS